MGIGKFLGGLGIAYEGMRAGEQDALTRDNAAADRSFQLRQRAISEGQQQRMLDEQARADDLRKKNAAVPAAGTLIDGVTPAASGGSDANTDPTSIDAQNGSDVGAPQVMTPAPRAVTQDEELRNIAKNYHAAGDMDTAFKMSSAADKIGMQRAAQQFQQLKAGSTGKTALQIAQDAAEIYNNDPLPGQITGVTDLGGGAVRISMRNRDTGQVAMRDVKSPEDVLQALEGYYSPDTFAAYQKAKYQQQIKSQAKVDEERAKGHVVGPGATFVPGAGDTRSPYHNPKEFNPNAGKPPADPVSIAQKFAFEAITKGDAKFASPEIRTSIAAAIPQLMSQYQQETGRALPPEMAANAAVKAITHPELVKPAININTGKFDSTITDDQSGETLTIRSGVSDGTTLPTGMKPEDAKAMTNEMVTKLDSRAKGAGTAYVKAAFDKSGAARAALEKQTAGQTQAAAQALPNWSTLSPDQQKAVVDRLQQQATQVLQSRLALVTKFGDPLPDASSDSSSLLQRLRKTPGLVAAPAAGATPQSLDEYKAWVKDRLMGPFSGTAKLLDISRTNADPKIREAAKSLYDDAMRQNSDVDTTATTSAL